MADFAKQMGRYELVTPDGELPRYEFVGGDAPAPAPIGDNSDADYMAKVNARDADFMREKLVEAGHIPGEPDPWQAFAQSPQAQNVRNAMSAVGQADLGATQDSAENLTPPDSPPADLSGEATPITPLLDSQGTYEGGQKSLESEKMTSSMGQPLSVQNLGLDNVVANTDGAKKGPPQAAGDMLTPEGTPGELGPQHFPLPDVSNEEPGPFTLALAAVRKYGSFPTLEKIKGLVGVGKSAWATTAKGAELTSQSFASFFDTLNSLSWLISDQVGIPREEVTSFLAKQFDYWAKTWGATAKENTDPQVPFNDFAINVVGRLLHFPVGIGEFELDKKGFGFLRGALRRDNKGQRADFLPAVMNGATEQAKTLMMDKMLKSLNVLGPWARTLSGGGLFGAQNLIEDVANRAETIHGQKTERTISSFMDSVLQAVKETDLGKTLEGITIGSVLSRFMGGGKPAWDQMPKALPEEVINSKMVKDIEASFNKGDATLGDHAVALKFAERQPELANVTSIETIRQFKIASEEAMRAAGLEGQTGIIVGQHDYVVKDGSLQSAIKMYFGYRPSETLIHEIMHRNLDAESNQLLRDAWNKAKEKGDNRSFGEWKVDEALKFYVEHKLWESPPETAWGMAAKKTGDYVRNLAARVGLIEGNHVPWAISDMFYKAAGYGKMDTSGWTPEMEGEPNPVYKTAERELNTEQTNYSVKSWDQNAKDNLRKVNNQNKLVPTDKLEKWIKDVDSVSRIIINQRPDLDYTPDRAHSSLKDNGDPQYKYSTDFSTICPKRVEYQATIEKIASDVWEKEQRTLTRDDLLNIRQMMQGDGREVSCGPCYVDASRLKAWAGLKPLAEKYPDLAKYMFSADGWSFLKQNNPDVYTELRGRFGALGGKGLEPRTDYRGEILSKFANKPDLVSRFNAKGGMRFQSWSDFETPHLIDDMQVVTDAAVVGLKGQAYTKVPDFVELNGKTGMMINMSLMPPLKGDGFDTSGKLIFDPVEGMDPKRAFELRDKFPQSVGTILVGISDAHIRAALADPRIDFVIPYHHSGLGKELRVKLNMDEWKDYTKSQKEQVVDQEKNKSFLQSKIDEGIPLGEAKYLAGTVPFEEFKGDLNKYKQLLEERGLSPKFPQFIDDPNYMKLLTDRRIWDNKGKYIDPKPMQANFNMATVREILQRGSSSEATPYQPVVDNFLSGNTSYQVKQTPLGFYSKLEETLDRDLPGKGSADQYAKTLESWAKSGKFKPEELKWSGVLDWLKEQDGKVTKAEVLDWLRTNNVEVQEVVKGEPGRPLTESEYKEFQAFFSNHPKTRAEKARFKELEAIRDANNSPTEFSQWQTPGGENYRELLLTLPNKTLTEEQARSILGAKSDAKLSQADIEYASRKSAQEFNSGHYDEPNILAHIRFNERTDSDGKKVLYLEEIQSDWGQKGREEGFRGTPDQENVDYINNELQKLLSERSRLEGLREIGEANALNPRIVILQRALQTARQGGEGKGPIPAAPFVSAHKFGLMREGKEIQFDKQGNEVEKDGSPRRFQSMEEAEKAAKKIEGASASDLGMLENTPAWTMLAVKRMIRWAAEHGFDRIAWTPGEVQAERYDLIKHLKEVSAYKNGDGTYQLAAEDKNGNDVWGYAGKKVTPTEMADSVGKEVAEKLIVGADAAKGKPWPKGVSNNPEFFRIFPKDLKIGDEGMKGYYGQPGEGLGIVGSEINKYAKKWGVQVGESTISDLPPLEKAARERFEREWASRAYIEDRDEWISAHDGNEQAAKNDYWNTFKSDYEDSVANDRELNPEPSKDFKAHSLDITPEMRKEVMEKGQTSFQVKSLSQPSWSWEKYGTKEMPVEIEERVRDISKDIIAGNLPKELDKYAININIEKYDGDLAPILHLIADRLKGEIQTARRGVHTWSMAEESAQQALTKDLGLTIKKILKRKEGQAWNDDMFEAARVLVNSNLKEITRRAEEIRGGDNSDQKVLEFRRLCEFHSAIQLQLSGATAEAGRALNILRKMAGDSSPLGEYLKTPDFSRQVDKMGRGEILDLAKEISLAAESGENVTKLNTLIRNKTQKTWWDWVLAFRYHAMLSGIRTQVRNALGNLFVAGLAPVERGVAYGVGRVFKALGDESPHVEAEEATAMLYGYLNKQFAALDLAWSAMKSGQSQFGEASKYAVSDKALGASGGEGLTGKTADFLWNALNIQSRALVSADEYFKAINFYGELRAQAWRQARAEGKEGQGLKDRVDELYNDPNREMVTAATDAANNRTFNDSLEGSYKWFTKALDHPIGKLIVPFQKVPYNIFKYANERTPFALLMPKFYAEMKAGGARRDLAMAKLITGSSIMGLAAALAHSGLITGGGPTNKDERNVWTQNFAPYSFKVGNKWVSYNNLAEPVGSFFALVADYHDLVTDWRGGNISPQTLATGMAVSYMKNFASKTFVKGIMDTIHMMDDPERYTESFVNSMVGSFVPSYLKSVAEGGDPEAKLVWNVMDSIKQGVPGWRDGLSAKRDFWGNVVVPNETHSIFGDSKMGRIAGSTVAAISPTPIKTVNPDDADAEMWRLRMGVQMPKKIQDFGKSPVELSAEQYSRMLELAGQEIQIPFNGVPMGMKDAVDNLISSPGYQRLVEKSDGPEGLAAAQIKQVIGMYRERAKMELMKEYPDIGEKIDEIADRRSEGLHGRVK